MNEEFKKSGINTVTSSDGFVVEVKFTGGVFYRDREREVYVDSEWTTKPHGILLYRTSNDNKGLSGLTNPQIDAIFIKLIRALQFLGHRAETL